MAKNKTQKVLVGVAPLTMARTALGGYIQIYEGDPVPEGLDAKDRKRLTDRGFIGEIEVPVTEEEDDDESGNSDKVADILAEVGDDKEKAAAALEAENAKERPRKTLVEPLEAIVNA